MSDIALINSEACNGGDLSRLPRSARKARVQVRGHSFQEISSLSMWQTARLGV